MSVTRVFRIVVVAAALLSAASASAQTPAANTVVRGRVVAADTGDALRNARVALASDHSAAAVLTDAEGRFAIAAPVGHRDVAVSKTGYAAVVALLADDVEVRLARGAVITGRVTDERGVPLPMLTVVADRIVHAGSTVSGERAAFAETDDRGEYRLFGLPAGDYAAGVIGGAVTVAGGANVMGDHAGAFSYYPGVPFLQRAQPIHVAAGDEVAGIDLTNRYIVPPTRNASGLIVPTPTPRKVLPPPSEPGPPGTIRGRVVGPEGLPLARARVELESGRRLFSPDSTQTDDDGWYAFHDVAAGSYVLATTMPGFARTAVGQRSPWERGELVTMGADRADVRIDVTLRRGNAIVGRVLDEYGDPVQNAAVTTSAIRVLGGRKQLVGWPRAAIRASTRTDDRGRFRVYALSPGQYVVAAAVVESQSPIGTSDLPIYPRTYYPATLSPNEATLVEVREGEDRLNIDVTLVKGGTARVAGRVIGSTGRAASATVSLTASYRSGAIATAVRSIKADGNFEFENVPPGEYVVQAGTSRRGTSTEGQFAARFVTVAGVDVTDLTLAMSAGSTISGRFVFDDGDAPATTDGFELSPLVSDSDFVSLASDPVARADVHDDWTFEMSGVSGPRRLQVVHAPDGWMVKAILINGLDVTDEPMVFGTDDQSLRDVAIVMTNRVSEIAGTVADENTHGSFSDAAVVVFAAERARWYAMSRFVAVADASDDASFVVRELPPADYFVAAVEKRRFTDIAGEIDNPELLESLVANATRVTLGAGQRVSLTLRVPAR
jgi:hypothetical protein